LDESITHGPARWTQQYPIASDDRCLLRIRLGIHGEIVNITSTQRNQPGRHPSLQSGA
jgi:hypothetical protein